ncbi:MAG TPA: CocE/NonD family hydrolase [Candidatus Hydrogenedentes bacterium]|nr:CocE/NonD family hydrolase [Candidatus Hydrogenedentota bacterium]
MTAHRRYLRLLFLLTLVLAPTAYSVGPQTVMVEMTDGTKLATDYYVPEEGGPAFPVILARSTYGRALGMKDGERFNGGGYAFVIQDVRGMGASEGEKNVFYAEGWRESQHDGADTVAWIKAQEWCNGKIGTYGGSALGMTQVLLAPATRDVVFQFIEVAPSSWYGQVAYQGGVFRKSPMEGWLTLIGQPHVIDLYKSHPTCDAFWTYYNAESKAPDITAAALHVGGWYDIFQQGTINNFVSRQNNGGPGAKGNQKLIMKWSPHGPDVTPDYTHNENRFDLRVSHQRDALLDAWLKGNTAAIADMPTVWYYTLGDDAPGAPGMEWRTADGWPPFPTVDTPYFLGSDGRLTPDLTQAAAGSRSFTYDPANPFPTHGGANLLPTLPSGPFDQRKGNEGRNDVLKFATEPLVQPVEATGRVRARLYVSSDAPDTDFTAKLIDVFPQGDEREILVLDNIQRVKYRNGFEEPAPLLTSADEVVEVEIDLWSISWVFNTGHQIGLQISSSNYPRFDKNPNTGDDFPSEDNLRVANNTVHSGKTHPSALLLPLRDLSADDDGNGLTVLEEWAAAGKAEQADAE